MARLGYKEPMASILSLVTVITTWKFDRIRINSGHICEGVSSMGYWEQRTGPHSKWHHFSGRSYGLNKKRHWAKHSSLHPFPDCGNEMPPCQWLLRDCASCCVYWLATLYFTIISPWDNLLFEGYTQGGCCCLDCSRYYPGEGWNHSHFVFNVQVSEI